MTKPIGVQLIIYGILLAGISFVAASLDPALARTTLVTGSIGAVLCLVWGIWAVKGGTSKALAILTLIPISFALLAQTIMSWWGGTDGAHVARTAAAVVTLLFLLSVAMLMRIAYAGMVFEGAGGRHV